MQVIDLSHRLEPGMTLFPGTPEPVIQNSHTISTDGYNQKELRVLSHMGTHVDAPAHLLAEGRTLDQFPLGHFTGTGMKVDVSGYSGGFIPVEVFQHFTEQLNRVDYLLLESGWSVRWKTGSYLEDFPCLSNDAAGFLAAQGLRGIGIDMISVDPVSSTELPVHYRLLGAEMLIIENLDNLHLLPETGFTLQLFPLPVAGADGMPVRAAALIE